MKQLTICIQCTLRPKILSATLNSFCYKLFEPASDIFEYHIVCNIDPIGEQGVCANDMKQIVTKFFGCKHTYIFFTPNTPNFTSAVIRTWTAANTDYLFNLEDDWLLNYQTELIAYYTIMEHNPRIVSLTMPKAEWKRYYFSQNPSFVRTSWAQQICPKLNLDQSVEHQLDLNTLNGEQLHDIHSCYPYFMGKPCISDIGRKWRRKHGFKKNGYNFSRWVKGDKR